MFWIKIRRITRSGYLNFRRSVFPSTASVLIMVITLFVITGLLYVQVVLNSSLNKIKERVDVTVYFVPGASEFEIEEIEKDLSNLPEVQEVTYVSSDQALANFKEKHSNDYLTLQALEDLSSNPLGASLNIRAKDPSQYESISNYFKNLSFLSSSSVNIIENVNYLKNKVAIDRLNTIIKGSMKLGLITALVFIFISFLIVFNTIRLIIYMSREEINVMKLVGASGRYIKGPFVISGILVGVVSAFISTILFLPISFWLGHSMTDFLGINLFSYYKTNFLQIFLVQLISGIFIGGISSLFAINRYLRK